MAKFSGMIGFGEQKEVSNGVWDVEITERPYYGDVIRNSHRYKEADKVNSDLTLMNSISIVADAYLNANYFAIKYVEWAGVRWIVTHAEIDSPRLVLRLGSVYNGPTPTGAGTPSD